MATVFTGSRDTATSTSTITNKVIQALPLPYEQTKDYSTFLQVLGSQAAPSPGLGTGSSTGTFSRSSVNTTALTVNSRGKVSTSAVYNAIRNEIANSRLAGFVPADARKYGIDRGNITDSYSSLLTQLVGFESGFNPTRKGDIGRYLGGSNGLFQLSPNDALTYGFQKTPFTIQQLQDPSFNIKIGVKIFEANVLRDGVISGMNPGSQRPYLGGSAYWGPLRPDRVNQLRPVPGKFTPITPVATSIASDKVQKMSELAWEYNKSVFSPNPIDSKIQFFKNFDENAIFYGLDNKPIFDYFSIYKSELDIVKDSLTPEIEGEDSFLAPPGDCVGFWATNVGPKYTDNVAPYFDFNSFGSITGNYALVLNGEDWTTEYGGPFNVPGSTLQKIPDDVYTLTADMSDITKSIENYNFQNLVKPDASADLYGGTDQTQSTELVGSTDLPSYLDHYNNKSFYLDEFKSQFPNTFEYISFFNTVNDNPGFNPRDYKSKNLEQMTDFYAELNVEGQIVKVDILLKKYKGQISNRSIKKSLCLCDGCSEAENEQGSNETIDTATINKRFLEQGTTRGGLESAKTKGLLNNKIPLIEQAELKYQEAQNFLALPEQKVAELVAKIDSVGINNLPGLQGVTGPLNDILGSASGLTSILQSPLNLPNVLPSLDAGSFPQIAGLLTNTNWKNLDVNSTIEIAKQLNTIFCDFRLPIIGKINWDDITDIDIGDFGGEFEKLIQGMQKKFEKLLTDIRDKIKNLIPNFIENFKSFFKDIFTCDQSPNVKDSDNKAS